jgi:hypothetical protein
MSGEGGLVLRTSVPLVFHPAAEGSAVRASHADIAHNLGVFQACELFDDRPSSDRGDADPAVMHELRRIDVKLTLVMELLLDLRTAAHGGLADRIEVELDFRGLGWATRGSILSRGTRGMAELFVHPQVPRPLRLFGTIIESDPGTGRVRLHFDPLSEAEADQLERLIFRAHRRLVAGTRTANR